MSGGEAPAENAAGFDSGMGAGERDGEGTVGVVSVGVEADIVAQTHVVASAEVQT